MLFRPAFEPEAKIADVVHQLLRDRSIDRAFAFQDNLRDVGRRYADVVGLDEVLAYIETAARRNATETP